MKKIFLLFLLFLFLPFKAEAASAFLYLSPANGTYSAGSAFSAEIKLNSGGVAVNASEGVLIFDKNILEVKIISKTTSIFNIWVQEPSFSNTAGTINFAGGKPTPGFTGSSGTVITITFKAKTAGVANITFTEGSVLADDGKGTNVLANMNPASYNIVAESVEPAPLTKETLPQQTSVTQVPVVSSKTHGDPEKWYSNNTPEFFWKLPAGVDGVSLMLNQKPLSNPGNTSDGLLDSKKFEDVADGVWYFHIKFRNQYGWGEISHRKVLIDTKPPEFFEITVDNKNDPTNPSPDIILKSQDSLSGIQFFQIDLCGGESKKVLYSELKDNSYTPPLLPFGKCVIKALAFDGAENKTASSVEFEILPIESPKIISILSAITTGETLTIKGESLPDTTVMIYIQKSNDRPILEEVPANEEGKFLLKYDKLAKGNYQIWAQAKDKRGVLSRPTEKFPLKVSLPAILNFGIIAVNYLTVILVLVILIGVLLSVIFYVYYRISLWKKRLRQETKEAAQNVTAAFWELRREVEEQISALDEKPGLTKGEKIIRNNLREALNISEQFIKKEIKDVEKELE